MGETKVTRFGRKRRRTITQSTVSQKLSKFDLVDLNWTNNIPECPVYHPTEQEFEQPLVYLQKIAPEASKYGICKIVSPIVASNPAATVLMKEKKNFKFETIVQPLRLSKWNNDIITFSMRGRKYTYHEFEALANKAFLNRFCSSEGLSSSYVEKEFWNVMAHGGKGTVEYGVNIDGSAFSCQPNDNLGSSKWNLKNFSRLPQSPLRLIESEIPGVTDPMLYIGMLFSMFAWHVEDHYLYSINYHHSGANKTWYSVPSYAASEFEKTVLHHVYSNEVLTKDEGEDAAFQFLAHKTTMFPPSILLQHDVPVYKALQKPGEFVITFPRAYHAGFSNGFNCGEAVNFAMGNWFLQGSEASKRYAHLRILPIIPYEELLCKEAMQVYNSLKATSSENKLEDASSYRDIIQPFLHLMEFYNSSILQLNSSTKLPSSSNTLGSITCSLCYRDCYVAYLLCKFCYSHPICLFHDIASENCNCGRKYVVFKRNEILALGDDAKSFQQEKQSNDTSSLSTSIYNRNEFIKDLKDNLWHEEKCGRRTAN